MPVKVVTDSVADLPSQVVEELGITVIPLNVRFGEKVTVLAFTRSLSAARSCR